MWTILVPYWYHAECAMSLTASVSRIGPSGAPYCIDFIFSIANFCILLLFNLLCSSLSIGYIVKLFILRKYFSYIVVYSSYILLICIVIIHTQFAVKHCFCDLHCVFCTPYDVSYKLSDVFKYSIFYFD